LASRRKRLIGSLLGIAAIGGLLFASFLASYHVHAVQNPGEFCALCNFASAPLLCDPALEILAVSLHELGSILIGRDHAVRMVALSQPSLRAPPAV
jgi:hypothetical protein